MEWQQWQSVSFMSRDRLPECSGIYVVADCNNFVWYVGQAKNLKSRWLGRGHHRYPQLIRTNRKLEHKIYWTAVSISQLDQQERYYVDLFRPELNSCKVKTYLPKQPQNEREIKRLLRVLNSPNLLYPILRSVVAGEYCETDGKHHILILTNLNDLKLLEKSMRKRAPSVRQAWTGIQCYCGKDPELYRPCWLDIYTVGDYCFEFIAMPELLDSLRNNSALTEKNVGTQMLLGIQVQGLSNLQFLDTLDLEVVGGKSNYSSTYPLKAEAYLMYRKSSMTCFKLFNTEEGSSVEVS